MIIKKFLGKTEEEAVANAKKELGENIVIMNVKETKRKGFFAFLRSRMVEVTVALEDETERNGRRRELPPLINVSKAAEYAVSNEEKSFGEVLDSTADGSKVEKIEEKLDSLQSMLEQQFQKKEESTEEKKIEENRAEEEEQKDDSFVKFTKLLYQTMLDNEVDESYINQIMADTEKAHKPGMPFDYALANTYQKMILKFGKPEEITPAEKGPKVVFFVGPTGVGKTTTIAKIASKFHVEEKKKIALLTADTYRIAAVEQLRVYANILNVPFQVIYTVEEVEEALSTFAEYDYIFVDTTGHSPLNSEQKDNMCSFVTRMEEKVESETYLVLSATTKYRDLLRIADAYKGINSYKLIFTKLDETSAVGNLLNLKLYTGAALSYVTYGQNVPNDISVFNPQKIVKLLLGGKK